MESKQLWCHRQHRFGKISIHGMHCQTLWLHGHHLHQKENMNISYHLNLTALYWCMDSCRLKRFYTKSQEITLNQAISGLCVLIYSLQNEGCKCIRMSELTYPVQNKHCNKLYQAVQSHVLENSKTCHKSTSSFLYELQNTGYVGNCGRERSCNWRFSLRQWNTNVSSFQSLWNKEHRCISDYKFKSTHIFLLHKLAVHPLTVNPNNSWYTTWFSHIHSTTLEIYSMHINNKKGNVHITQHWGVCLIIAGVEKQ